MDTVVQVYHGGFRLPERYQHFEGKNPQLHQGGPSLYFTTDIHHARTYAKGPRVLYEASLILRPEASLDAISLSPDAILQGLSSLMSQRAQLRLAELIRTDTHVTLNEVVNLLVYLYMECGKFHANWSGIQRWISEQGGAYFCYNSFGKIIYTVYDPRIVSNIRGYRGS